jgi:hypothetical protein
MRSRDRLPSQQEILDGPTPSAELSPLEVLRVMQLRSLSAVLRKNSFRGHAASLSERNSCCKPPRTGALIRFVCSVEGRYRPKYAAFALAKSAHLSGRSSKAKMAETGQTGTHARSRCIPLDRCRSSRVRRIWGHLFGWMQSTGQASMHAVSLVPMQGSAITYAI